MKGGSLTYFRGSRGSQQFRVMTLLLLLGLFGCEHPPAVSVAAPHQLSHRAVLFEVARLRELVDERQKARKSERSRLAA